MNSLDIVLGVMRDAGRRDAADLRVRAPDLNGTAIIREETKAPNFDPQKDYTDWPRGSPVTDEGQVWLLLQPYNAAHYEGRPSTLRALWGLAHTKDPDRAKPFVAPFGTSGIYMTGECVAEDGGVYVCNRDNVVHPPAELPEAWDKIEM